MKVSNHWLVLNCLYLLIAICAHEYEKVNLTSLIAHSLARCLDGSPAGYYFQEAASPQFADKFVLVLNGGGECDNEQACTYATTSALGSSKYFQDQMDSSSWYFGNDDCEHNYDFCGWNHVFNPYCSQDLHSGQRAEANEWGLYFAGHHILEAILDDLDDRLRESTEILVTGQSAGGLGVWMNVDWIAKRYPQAKVTGVSIAGLYFYATYYDGPDATAPSTMADFREDAWPDTYALYEAFVDEDCAQAMKNPSACMLLNNSLPFIDSDVFVVQSETDQVVLEGHDCFPGEKMDEPSEKAFMQEWHMNMSIALRPYLDQNTLNSNGVERQLGAFAVACYTHVDFTVSHPLVQGLNYFDAFHKFFFAKEEDNLPSSYVLVDDCGELCNPSC